MKVLLLCGGKGTRLREHTETRPKPMVEVGGRPLLWHIMKIYASAGFKEFVMCLGYKGIVVKEYFLHYEAANQDFAIELGAKNGVQFHGDNHSEHGLKVTLADTGLESMTGARIKRAARYLDRGETFAVTYGDGVADIDLRKSLAFHRSHVGLATVTGVRPASRFGELIVNEHRVETFSEKPQVGQGLINGGFFFFEPGFLEYLSEEESCVLEQEPLERCAKDGRLYVYEHHGYWQCMDTLRDWEKLEAQWAAGCAPWKVW